MQEIAETSDAEIDAMGFNEIQTLRMSVLPRNAKVAGRETDHAEGIAGCNQLAQRRVGVKVDHFFKSWFGPFGGGISSWLWKRRIMLMNVPPPRSGKQPSHEEGRFKNDRTN
jgi:hypothetical protein